MDRVGPDLLRRAFAPGLQDAAAVLSPDEDGVMLEPGGIGVRGVAFAEGVLEAGAHVAEGLDLGAAQDRKPPEAAILCPPTVRAAQAELIVVVIGHGTLAISSETG